MVKSTYLILQILSALMFSGHCNLEVGNPEAHDGGLIRAQQTLSFNLISGTLCETTAQPCTSGPVLFSDEQQATVAYEMTSVKLQLAGIELKPLAEENISTQVDLLGGTSVVMDALENSTTTGIRLRFEPVAGLAPALYISGNLVYSEAGSKTRLPLSIVQTNSVVAETAIASGYESIEAVLFDANLWFDFRNSGNSQSQFLRGITGAACRDTLSVSCSKYRDQLARFVSERVSKSISIKFKPINAKSVSKGKIGG